MYFNEEFLRDAAEAVGALTPFLFQHEVRFF